jgi:DNA-binding transcriptional LysR family regulator
MSQFDDLFWLIEVADAGTLTAAAEKKGVTVAAVSKRIRAVEERLGVRLLNRNTRHLSLTEAGNIYYQRGKNILDELYHLEEHVISTSERLLGDIRINAPLSFSLNKMSELLVKFQKEHTSINVTLHLDDHFIDVHNSEYDLIIRIGKLPDSSVIAQRLATVKLVCCATPEYLAKNGIPQTPAELSQHNCLEYDQINRKDRWVFRQNKTEFEVYPKGKYRVNNGDMILAAVLEHHGIALLPDFIANESLKAGLITPVLTDYEIDELNVYALYASRNFLPAKIKRLIEFLKSELDEEAQPSS